MEQFIVEAAETEITSDQSSIQELSLAQLALVGGGEVHVTFD
jgi:hypothetical protein